MTHLIPASLTAWSTWKTASRLARRNLLEAWREALRADEDVLARLMAEETGKPITLAKAEVNRGQLLLLATMEVVANFGEEAIPYDLMPGAEGCRAVLRREPLGVILAITAFNFPVILAIHKLAPAIGAGCAAIWKPCPQAPRTSTRLMETFESARRAVGAPEHLIQLADIPPTEAEALARDERVAMVSFTGSERVGMHLRHVLGSKPLVLELGGNGAVVLDEGIDVQKAARQLAPAAVASGGQSCCKAQRFYVHAAIWEAFQRAYVAAVQALPVGDPMDPATVVGPLIDEAAAQRAEAAVAAAVAQGATLLHGGPRQGALFPPTILTMTDDATPICCEEAFAPISVLVKIEGFEEGLERAAATRFGLRASAYSVNARHLQMAQDKLRAGTVLLNLPTTFRLDQAPFSALGASGQGLEGPRWAMEAFTEARLIVEGRL